MAEQFEVGKFYRNGDSYSKVTAKIQKQSFTEFSAEIIEVDLLNGFVQYDKKGRQISNIGSVEIAEQDYNEVLLKAKEFFNTINTNH